MKNLVFSEGSQRLELVAGAAKTGGKLYVEGDFVGIAVATVANGELFTLLTKAVVSYKKKTADTFAIGAKAYYDAVNDEITSTAGGNKLVGQVMTAIGAVAGEVVIRLNDVAV